MKRSRILKLLSVLLVAITVVTLASLPSYAQTVKQANTTVAATKSEQTVGYTLGAGPSYRPIFGTAAGTYEKSVKIKLSTVQGATIYYTYNGKTPTTSSKKYTGAFKITKSCTVKAIAVYNGKTSGVAQAEYVIKVKKPTFSVSGGYYTSAQSVTLTGMDSKTVIYYTTDGSKPTTKSKKYTGPIKVSDYAIISARAYRSGCTKSDVVTQEYKIYKSSSSSSSTNQGEYITNTFQWNDGKRNWTYNLSIYKKDYKRYYDTVHYIKPYNPNSWAREYDEYVNDTSDNAWVKSIVDDFMRSATALNYTKEEKLYMIITFVQNIRYQTDQEALGLQEFVKYPLVTLYDKEGDCEDSAILLAAMLRAAGYDCVLLEYVSWENDGREGHMAVGIAGDFSGYRHQYNGKNYFYIETTATGWKIGNHPEGYDNARIWKID